MEEEEEEEEEGEEEKDEEEEVEEGEEEEDEEEEEERRRRRRRRRRREAAGVQGTACEVGALALPARHYDVRASLGEHPRGLQPDACVAAGDDRRLAGQVLRAANRDAHRGGAGRVWAGRSGGERR